MVTKCFELLAFVISKISKIMIYFQWMKNFIHYMEMAKKTQQS